jgi:hypothetical protein
MTSAVQETYEVGPITCGHCGNTAFFTVVAEDFSGLVTHEFEHETPWGKMDDSVQRGWVHRMLICSVCKRASFDRMFTQDGEPEQVELLYPPPILIPDGLPDRVVKEYGEALNERRRNPNGYAALLGRVLDAVCTDRGIPTHTPDNRLIFLGKRLEMLVAKEGLVKIEGATALRNVAAHADRGSLVPADIPYLEALIRYVLDHLYIIPAINQKAVATQTARRPVTSESPSNKSKRK